jgi:alkaline phosphatase D
MTIGRREFLFAAPALLRAQKTDAPPPVMAGDVVPGRAVVWARAPRASRMLVTWRSGERGEKHRVRGPECAAATDFTGRVDLTRLPAGQTILYEVQFEESKSLTEPSAGSFRTPGGADRDVTLLWSGDTAGQGWGINPDWGGMRIYETMRRRDADLFVHSGDNIYADGPIQAEVKLKDGTVWRNLVTPEKSKPAETLDEFRGAYRYNLMDANFRRFNASLSQVWQWDDHEVMDNWSPGKELAGDARYREKSIAVLAGRARQAFLEYAPLRIAPRHARIFRRIPYGPLLDVFLLDMRSYRGANSFNRQTAESPETDFLGRPQLEWLKQGLLRSRAAWKIVAADMPLGLLVSDGKDAEGRPRFEAVANGDGPALGRELEIARLLAGIKPVKNVIWLTADVHYTAAHYFDPSKARFTDFSPFWEFVSGPLNAGTFGPGTLDDTFGIQVAFQKAPPPGQANLPPSAGLQFFGEVKVDARTRGLSVTLRDLAGADLFTKAFPPG